jgi:glutamate 5-kinase
VIDLVRQEVMSAAQTVVVKVGSRVLTRDDGTLDHRQVEAIAGQIAAATKGGRRVALVSSGAVAAGIGRLGWKQRPTALAELQAAAAVGQSSVIEAYQRALAPHGLHAAQVLLTAGDLHDRTRYLNVRNTLWALFQCDAVPIINENDTVAVEELQMTFGDNDRLAALVTNLLQAPLLVLLSDVEGVFDHHPDDPAAQRIAVLTDLEHAQSKLVCDTANSQRMRLSTGGMASKLQAAGIAVAAGENVVIASGRRANVLTQVLAAEDVGTLVLAEGRAVAARKRWIGWSVTPRGKLTLDEGACRALREQGRSLLAIGIAATAGNYQKGDVLAICGPSGEEFARGLTNYASAELSQIVGKQTDEIAEILGHRPYDEVVHRNNLVLLGS